MPSTIGINFLQSIAADPHRPETEREDAIHALATAGDETTLEWLIALYDQPASANLHAIILNAIAILTARTGESK